MLDTDPLNKYLPTPSFLEKLKTHKEDAPNIIMALTDAKLQLRHDEDKKLSSIFKSKAFWKGVVSVLTLAPLFQPRRNTPAKILHDTVHESWQTVGNNFRLAIIEYMHDNNITPSDINLTQDEINDLGWTKKETHPKQKP